MKRIWKLDEHGAWKVTRSKQEFRKAKALILEVQQKDELPVFYWVVPCGFFSAWGCVATEIMARRSCELELTLSNKRQALLPQYASSFLVEAAGAHLLPKGTKHA